MILPLKGLVAIIIMEVKYFIKNSKEKDVGHRPQ